MKALLDYSWPRNVRELEHVLYRASVEITAPVLGADEVKRLLEGGSSSDAKPPGRPRRVVVERSELEEALGQSWGNKREAARRLGISPSLLYKLIEQHGIVIPKRTPKTGRNVP
jgi:DNA-binding NtrC family response regulator